jgi:hypothetical protein
VPSVLASDEADCQGAYFTVKWEGTDAQIIGGRRDK